VWCRLDAGAQCIVRHALILIAAKLAGYLQLGLWLLSEDAALGRDGAISTTSAKSGIASELCRKFVFHTFFSFARDLFQNTNPVSS
jgi:hypothetical protein